MPAVRKASTAYVVLDVVVPSTRNGHMYRPSKAGTSATAEPAWPIKAGETVNDNTVTWKEAGYTWPVAWRASQQYQAGALVLPIVRNGHRYEATNSGMSGTTEPSWPLVAGGTVTGGGITWKEAGAPEPVVRPDQSQLTKVEKARYVAAVKKMKADLVWDDYVRIHRDLMPMSGTMDESFGHAGPAFYPWHRYFQFQLELDLQRADYALGNDGDLTTIWWDWVSDQATDPMVNGLWDNDFMGDSRAPGPVPGAFSSGWPITVQPMPPTPPDALALERNLGGSSDSPNLPTATAVSAVHAVSSYDANPWTSSSAAAGSFRNSGEGWDAVAPNPVPGVHNRVHDWVGRHLANFETSPNDPLFFLHHANVDRLWVRWQKAHSPVDQYNARLPAGPTMPAPNVVPGVGTSLPAGTYWYEVAAATPTGHTARSSERQVSTAASGARVELTWSSVTAATNYLIYRRSLTTGYALYRVVGAVASFNDTGPAPVGAAPPRPSTQPRLGHAFDDPMIPWDGRPDPRPAPYRSASGRYPVIRPRDVLSHAVLGYRYDKQPLIRVIAKKP